MDPIQIWSIMFKSRIITFIIIFFALSLLFIKS